jgi:hypothetical protein
MPAYSQRKRKIAKKSTRRSKKRLSRRIKTRRGGGDGKINIDKFKDLLVAKLDASTQPEFFDAGTTAQNFINNRKKLIEEMINAFNEKLDSRFELKQKLKQMLEYETEWDAETGKTVLVNNQIYINLIDEVFKNPE